jgi:hypothetical protein
MEHQEPNAAEEALRRLEERLDRASDAAERMIAEAAAAAAGGAGGAGASGEAGADAAGASGAARTQTPPAGWQIPGSSSQSAAGGDLDVLMQVVHALRDLIPPELQKRLAEALRELLLALRALIDWYLERSERRRAAPTKVQDIPIS